MEKMAWVHLSPSPRLSGQAAAVEQSGIVAVAIRNSSHIGMIGYYCEKRAREGLICIAMTESEALVHPHGGTKALVGTNPIAIGIPSEPAPFVFDMATSTSAIGKIYASKHRGEPIPLGWAIDAEGNPTTNPDDALKGSLTPAAGPKGYGLGISIGILAGLLPGGEIGRLVLGTLDTEFRCTKGDFFLLLNPAAFAGGPALASRVASYLDELRHSPPQKGIQSVIVPGDRARSFEKSECAPASRFRKKFGSRRKGSKMSSESGNLSGVFRPQAEYFLDGERRPCCGCGARIRTSGFCLHGPEHG